MIKKHIFNSSRPQAHLTSNHKQASPAFTIVELLVVIVIIGILAAITIVSYTGITQRATIATIQSDLTNAANQLKVYQVANMTYPNTIDCSSNPAANSICLKASSNNTFTYSPNNTVNPPTFNLTETNTNGTSYNVTDNSQPVAGIGCPTGFIPVPGSSTYGTSDFCVMKYEAKNDGNNNAVSVAAGTPWVNITQTSSISTAAAACTGCHLITEAEWMTITQNVLSVPSNWSGGAVGSGYIYSGHNDNVPANALPVTTNDSDGYNGTGNTSPSNQRRTLTLTNGQVIWDLAGNVWEWTNATIAGGQQPGLTSDTGYNWHEWNNASVLWNGFSANSRPTGISGASNWTSTNGIGALCSYYGETGLHGFLRSGSWNAGSIAGILALGLYDVPSGTGTDLGFRVSR